MSVFVPFFCLFVSNASLTSSACVCLCVSCYLCVFWCHTLLLHHGLCTMELCVWRLLVRIPTRSSCRVVPCYYCRSFTQKPNPSELTIELTIEVVFKGSIGMLSTWRLHHYAAFKKCWPNFKMASYVSLMDKKIPECIETNEKKKLSKMMNNAKYVDL